MTKSYFILLDYDSLFCDDCTVVPSFTKFLKSFSTLIGTLILRFFIRRLEKMIYQFRYLKDHSSYFQKRFEKLSSRFSCIKFFKLKSICTKNHKT